MPDNLVAEQLQPDLEALARRVEERAFALLKERLRPAEPEPAWLTTRQAADLLNTSHRNLQNWRMRGYGPPWVRVGKLVRYSRAELERWLAREVDDE